MAIRVTWALPAGYPRRMRALARSAVPLAAVCVAATGCGGSPTARDGTGSSPASRQVVALDRGTVPALVGLTQDAAFRAIVRAHLVPAVRFGPSSEPVGRVYAQSPARGTSVSDASVVTVHVSRDGPHARGNGLPVVTDLDRARARAILRRSVRAGVIPGGYRIDTVGTWNGRQNPVSREPRKVGLMLVLQYANPVDVDLVVPGMVGPWPEGSARYDPTADYVPLRRRIRGRIGDLVVLVDLRRNRLADVREGPGSDQSAQVTLLTDPETLPPSVTGGSE